MKKMVFIFLLSLFFILYLINFNTKGDQLTLYATILLFWVYAFIVFLKGQFKIDDLTNRLKNKELLLLELNHRIKNNLQTIISLIRLQKNNTKNIHLKDLIITLENRITSINHLYQLLYNNKDTFYINTHEYFKVLIGDIKSSYNKDINIDLKIQMDLKSDQILYYGLILNELVTNSFKYAFPNNKGNIYIRLLKKDNQHFLQIKDDGIGYTQKNALCENCLGLTLVKTLVEEQLLGEISIDSKNGVDIKILIKNKGDNFGL